MKLIFTTLLIASCCIPVHANNQRSMANINDIVINEIMADPSPQISLPEQEYIELYNASDSAININNWVLTIGKKEYSFNNIEIQANDYLILCHNDALEDLSAFGNCQGFSSFQITNSGCDISLIDNNGNLISSVEFDIAWHSSSYKKDGGWSLEQIDPHNPCAGKANWSSSVDRKGGTPGEANSIINENIIYPKLDHIYPVSNNVIDVFFNQNMNMENLQNIDNYIIPELNLNPENIEFIQHKSNYVKLYFNYNFKEGEIYTLNINNVTNCKDIPPEKKLSVQFGISSSAKENDITINEILFNPISPGVDYIELYNRSDKVIDLKEIMFGTIKKSFPNPADTLLKEICTEGFILLPYSYTLLSTDKKIVMYQYDIDYDTDYDIERNFLDVKSFPSLPNEEGHVIICDKSHKLIDEMVYSDKMHYELLTITQGVALERISSENSSLDQNNWHSASYNFNYGTPGYKNSMTANANINIKKNDISIIPEIFSPDGDAYDDICEIHYNLDENGYSININIFDSNGFLIKNLLNNNLVNNEGVIFWDGSDDNNHRVSPGIYIIQTEIFDLEGNVKRIRNAVVVATN